MYFVGTRADENVEPLVQELCEFRDSDSKALDEWQDLPSEGPVRLPRWHVYETSPDLWPSRADLISWQQSPPLFPYSKKRGKGTGLMNSMDFQWLAPAHFLRLDPLTARL